MLHEGATLCTEANTAGSGFRIGELNTDEGSTLQGYMKTGRSAFYMLGLTNTDMTLAGCLKDFVACGVMRREQFNEVPPHVEYSLTERGVSLMAVLDQLCIWGEKNRQN